MITLMNIVVILHAQFAVELFWKCATATMMMERILLLMPSNNGHLIPRTMLPPARSANVKS